MIQRAATRMAGSGTRGKPTGSHEAVPPGSESVGRRGMNTLLLLTRGLVLFVALFGFLFGQLFAGHFTPGAGLAGIFGLFSALTGTRRLQASPRWARAVVFSCLLALLGVALDIWNYYQHLAIAGSYYAWILIAPFGTGLLLILFQALALARVHPTGRASGGDGAAT